MRSKLLPFQRAWYLRNPQLDPEIGDPSYMENTAPEQASFSCRKLVESVVSPVAQALSGSSGDMRSQATNTSKDCL